MNLNRFHQNLIWEREQKRTEQARYSRENQVELERRLEKLSLICRAMWTLMQERLNISEKELANRTTEIDLLDGKADGRVSVPARQCPICKKTVAPRHERCLYCGGKKLMDSVFEMV